MKIALTLFNKEDEPMLVLEFDDYVDLRDYWKPRRKSIPNYKVQRVDDDELPAMRSRCVGIKPYIGAGWRQLDRDEIVMDGDQWWAGATGKWEDSRCIGQIPAPSTIYRRRHAGDGWRFLEDGEDIKSGDEYCSHGKWIPTALSGSVVGKFRSHMQDPEMPYRRRIGKNNPPIGYQIIPADEKVAEDDVFFDGRNWCPVHISGHKVGGGHGYFARPTVLITDGQTACHASAEA